MVKITAAMQLTSGYCQCQSEVLLMDLPEVPVIALRWQKIAGDFARALMYAMFWCITIKLSRAPNAV
jgi:hypothetical protein